MSNLEMWTIYTNPGEGRGEYVARKWIVILGSNEPLATGVTVKSKTLAKVRRKLPPGLVCLPRDPYDDPGIVESWM